MGRLAGFKYRQVIKRLWNNCFGRIGLNLLHPGITVIAFIGHDGLDIGRHGQQGVGLTHVGLFGRQLSIISEETSNPTGC